MERLHTRQRIYQMILDGYSYTKIMDILQISERTFYRYLDSIFKEDKDLIQQTLASSREEMRRQIIICRDRLLEDRQTLQQWMKSDPNFKPQDKINAMNLAAELSAAVLRLFEFGPTYLSKYDNSLPNRQRYYNNSLTEENGPGGTTGARLVLRKKPEEEEQEDQSQQKSKRNPWEIEQEEKRWY